MSVADIERDCGFSVFADTDRVTVLLAGAGLTLRFAHAPSLSLDPPHGVIRFPGEAEAACELAGGVHAQVLNIMTARGRASASISFADRVDEVSGEAVLIWCLSGESAVRSGGRLVAGEGLYGCGLPAVQGGDLLIARFTQREGRTG